MKAPLFILSFFFLLGSESNPQSNGYVLRMADGSVQLPANTITIAQIGSLQSSLDLKANLASPTFTGTVVLPSGQVLTTPSFTTGFTIGGAAATGAFPRGNGTNFVASTLTIPNAATTGDVLVATGSNAIGVVAVNATANKVLMSGASAVPTWSTPTFPNASATLNKIIKSDGTNWIASTETFAAPGTTGNIATSDGTNWTSAANVGGWTVLRVSGSNATTTGQTLVDITGLTSGTLTASTKYEIEAVLDCAVSAVTTGNQYGVFCGGSGGAGVVSVVLTGTTTGTTASSEVLSTTPATASTARLLTSGQSGTILLRGFVTTRGSGTTTISIQHLKVTSGTSTVNTGSVFRYRIAQ